MVLLVLLVRQIPAVLVVIAVEVTALLVGLDLVVVLVVQVPLVVDLVELVQNMAYQVPGLT